MRKNMSPSHKTFINKLDEHITSNYQDSPDITIIHKRMKSVIDLCKDRDQQKYKIIADAQIYIIQQLFQLNQQQAKQYGTIYQSAREQSINEKSGVSQSSSIHQQKSIMMKQLFYLRSDRINLLQKLNEEIKEHNLAKKKIIELQFLNEELIMQNMQSHTKNAILQDKQQFFNKNSKKQSYQSLNNAKLSSTIYDNHRLNKENVGHDLKKKRRTSKDVRPQKQLVKNYSTYNLDRKINVGQQNTIFCEKNQTLPPKTQMMHEQNHKAVEQLFKNGRNLLYPNIHQYRTRVNQKIGSKVQFDITPTIFAAPSGSSFSSSSGRPKTSLKSILDQRNRQEILLKEAELLFQD